MFSKYITLNKTFAADHHPAHAKLHMLLKSKCTFMVHLPSTLNCHN